MTKHSNHRPRHQLYICKILILPEEEEFRGEILEEESNDENDNGESLADEGEDDQQFAPIGVAPGTWG